MIKIKRLHFIQRCINILHLFVEPVLRTTKGFIIWLNDSLISEWLVSNNLEKIKHFIIRSEYLRLTTFNLICLYQSVAESYNKTIIAGLFDLKDDLKKAEIVQYLTRSHFCHSFMNSDILTKILIKILMSDAQKAWQHRYYSCFYNIPSVGRFLTLLKIMKKS